MKHIKIFIASSVVEFAAERYELSDFIRSLNDIYVRREIYFELIICENLSNSIAKERKQAEYNSFIRDSQYFYIIFGRGTNREDDAVYTIEEFDVALEQFKETGTPRIYTYFRQLPEGESASKNILSFMKRLDREIGHYYSTFGDIDTIKLNLLLELTRDPEVGDNVRIEDGKAILDNKEVLSVENIPVYSKNDTVQRLLKKKTELDTELGRLALEYAANPAGDAMQKILVNSNERNKIAEQLHALEMDILNLYRQASEKRQLGQKLNWRERDALKLIDEGNYAAAKTLLEDPTWKQEVFRAEEIIDTAAESIREYISGQMTLISTYKADGNSAEIAEKIIAIYQDISALAEKHRMELGVLYDYASFLYEQRQYGKARETAERLQHWCGLEENISECQFASLQNLLGGIFNAERNYHAAETLYREGLETYRKLAEADPGAYLPDVAMTSNNLANLLNDTGRMQEAEGLYREGQEIYRKLAEANPGAYLPYVAGTCNNLAALLNDTGRMQEAEGLYREGLEIYRKLAEANPGAYLPDVANTSNNLANLLKNTGRMQEAEGLYREGLEIYRKLAEANPDAYLPKVAYTCNNLAVLLDVTGRMQEAEGLYREGLEIYRKLAEANPDVYLPYVAKICYNLANLLKNTGRMQEAEGLYGETLEIYRKLAEANPGAYLPLVATICYNLGRRYSFTGRIQEAEGLYREGLEFYRKLAEANPDVYLTDVANTCLNLANLLNDTGRIQEAEGLYRKATQILENC